MPTVTPLPTPPNRGQAAPEFAETADTFLDALPLFATEVNAVGVAVGTIEANVAAADASADAAAASAAAAATFDPSSYLAKADNLFSLTNKTTARANLGVAIGTDVQAYDAQLAAIAGATLAADSYIYFTSATAVAVGTITTAGRALLDDADAAAQRVTLGLGDMATRAKATTAQFRAQAATDVGITVDNVNAAAAIVTLTDATTIALDWAAGINFDVTMAGNRTIGNPTNVVPGTTRFVILKGNDATARTISFGTNYKGNLPSLTNITSTNFHMLTLFAYTATHIVVTSIEAL